MCLHELSADDICLILNAFKGMEKFRASAIK